MTLCSIHVQARERLENNQRGQEQERATQSNTDTAAAFVASAAVQGGQWHRHACPEQHGEDGVGGSSGGDNRNAWRGGATREGFDPLAWPLHALSLLRLA